MKTLNFRDWLAESDDSGLTPEQVEFLNECTRGSWKLSPSTGLVNVQGDFLCDRKSLPDLKDLKFGKVTGSFYCNGNNLESLKGAPEEVGENFWCSDNRLKSLKGAPRKVGKDFYCGENQLTSLEGAPQKVGKDFSCSGNRLENLEGAPQKINGDFFCERNGLVSLKGAPREVGGMFWAMGNSLTTLESAPQKVGGTFACKANRLRSLEGAPREIGKQFLSDHFILAGSQWNLEGWLKIMKGGVLKARALVITLIPQDTIEQEIIKDPEGMMKTLKSIWDLPEFQETKKRFKNVDDIDRLVTMMQEGNLKSRSLILTAVPVSTLNQSIKEDPNGMIQKLKDVWNLSDFQRTKKRLKFPREYGDVDKMISTMSRVDSMKGLI